MDESVSLCISHFKGADAADSQTSRLPYLEAHSSFVLEKTAKNLKLSQQNRNSYLTFLKRTTTVKGFISKENCC